MDKQDRIWQLYARKMANEASEEELRELADLIRDDPSMDMQLQLLTEFWNSSPPIRSTENDEAFNRIIMQAEEPENTPLRAFKPVVKAKTPETKPRVTPRLRSFNKGILHNYAAVAWRNLVRNRSFSIINITGLALGMVSAVVILLWIFHELSVDQFHSKKDRVYQVLSRGSFDGKVGVWETTPKPLMATLKNDYPQVETAARINWVSVFVLHAGSQQLQVPGFFTDPDFFNIFDFPLLKGDPKTALSNEYSIVLTEKMAKNLFGNTDVMGHTLRIDSSDYFTVTGIVKDLPSNTDFNFNYLLPWSYMKKVGWEDTLWHANNVQTFALLKPGVTEQTANKLFANIVRKHSGLDNELFVHPMTKWHLYSNFENGVSSGGNIEMVHLFSIIAGFILLIACINYVNMSTARSQKRAREVGIRKVVGAGRGSLITQFLGESILIAFLAGIIALGLLQPTLIGFNHLINAKLSIPYSSITFWLTTIGFILCTGVLAGIYPAFYLSSYEPVRVLKSNFKRIKIFVTPRKLLVTLQFSFAIILIICTIVIYRQIRHTQQRDPGYNGAGLAYMYVKGEMEKNYPQIREDLIKSGAIISIARSNCPITDIWGVSDAYQWEGQPSGKRSIIINYTADKNYASTVGLKLLQGRDIDVYTYPSDSSAVLLNQAAVKLMGFTNPIGQHIKEYDRDLQVVGVVNNFIPNRPYQAFMPAAFRGDTKHFGAISFRLNRENEREDNLATIAGVFKKYNSEYPFECFFADDTYALKFRYEKKLATLAALFAGLTISISCLGLFALAACMAESRIKEIGVRKVLGASVSRITTLLSKDFLPPVLLSILIASPVAWWSMHQWLQGFSYRTSISWWVFVFAALLVIFIAIATVSYQTVKAALTNPVKSIRTE
ncbi:MAG TPA: ABC transporter permease [Chitinophagaceae bacterium]|nr:ABC transporter permease [Chitinophagaceae bacterium]